MIYGFNKKIACVPPEQKGAEMKVTHGMAVIQHRSSLMPLRVVFGSRDLPAGSTVYLPEQLKQQPWASQVYSIGDIKFVLIPEEQIVLVDLEEKIGLDGLTHVLRVEYPITNKVE